MTTIAEKFLSKLQENGLDSTFADIVTNNNFVARVATVKLQDVFLSVLRMIDSERQKDPAASTEAILSRFKNDDLDTNMALVIAQGKERKRRHRTVVAKMMD